MFTTKYMKNQPKPAKRVGRYEEGGKVAPLGEFAAAEGSYDPKKKDARLADYVPSFNGGVGSMSNYTKKQLLDYISERRKDKN